MPHAKTTGTQIDSPFTALAPVPKLDSAPGVYDTHPNVGPARATSGIPLKFMDESIKHGTMPTSAHMNVEPAKQHKS